MRFWRRSRLSTGRTLAADLADGNRERQPQPPDFPGAALIKAPLGRAGRSDGMHRDSGAKSISLKTGAGRIRRQVQRANGTCDPPVPKKDRFGDSGRESSCVSPGLWALGLQSRLRHSHLAVPALVPADVDVVVDHLLERRLQTIEILGVIENQSPDVLHGPVVHALLVAACHGPEIPFVFQHFAHIEPSSVSEHGVGIPRQR